MLGSFGRQEWSQVSGLTLRQVSGRAMVVVPSLAPNAVFWGNDLQLSKPVVGPPAGFQLGTCPDPPAWDPAVGTLVRTAPSIAQIIAGPPEALIMGALLTLQFLDIAIGAGHRWERRDKGPNIETRRQLLSPPVIQWH